MIPWIVIYTVIVELICIIVMTIAVQLKKTDILIFSGFIAVIVQITLFMSLIRTMVVK